MTDTPKHGVLPESTLMTGAAQAVHDVTHAAQVAEVAVLKTAHDAQTIMSQAAETAQAVLQGVQRLYDLRLNIVEKAVVEISESLKKMVSLDANIKTILEDVVDHESRVRAIESELPVLKLISKWVIAGVISLWGIAAIVLSNWISDRF